MRKLSERQVMVLRALASGSVLICHHTPGREHEPGGWRVEGRQKIDVLGATANGLFDRGFLKGAGRDSDNTSLYEISDAGRAALKALAA